MPDAQHARRRAELDHAAHFLLRVSAEDRKQSGKDHLAIEADLSACLGAIKAALNRLKKEVGEPTYWATLARWKGTLSPVERHRFDRMQNLRDLDVHEADIPMTLQPKAIPAPLVSGMTVFGSPATLLPATLLPNPVPGGDPPVAPAWVIASEAYLDADRAADACQKFLDLARRFVAVFSVSPAGTAIGA